MNFWEPGFWEPGFWEAAFWQSDPETEVKPDSIKWGYGPLITPEIKPIDNKRKRQNEAILLTLLM